MIVTELEIPMLDSQGADLCYAPGPGPRNPAPAFRLVNDMTEHSCIMEPFARTPTRIGLLRGCLRKQLQLFHNDCLNVEHKEAESRRTTGQRTRIALPPMRFMWVLSPGRPVEAIPITQPRVGHEGKPYAGSVVANHLHRSGEFAYRCPLEGLVGHHGQNESVN